MDLMILSSKNAAFLFGLVGLIFSGCATRAANQKSHPFCDNEMGVHHASSFLLVAPDSSSTSQRVAVDTRMVKVKVLHIPSFAKNDEEVEKRAEPTFFGLKIAKPDWEIPKGWNFASIKKRLGFSSEKTAGTSNSDSNQMIGDDDALSSGTEKVLMTVSNVVAPKNVPLGYYQSVPSDSGDGKNDSGWKYVGSSLTEGNAEDGESTEGEKSSVRYGLGKVGKTFVFQSLRQTRGTRFVSMPTKTALGSRRYQGCSDCESEIFELPMTGPCPSHGTHSPSPGKSKGGRQKQQKKELKNNLIQKGSPPDHLMIKSLFTSPNRFPALGTLTDSAISDQVNAKKVHWISGNRPGSNSLFQNQSRSQQQRLFDW